MVNLFDVATKELSQDAFLRWIFENYDRDDQFRKIVVDFISFLTKGQQGGRDQIVLEPGDITELKTFAQVDDVDIAIDFRSKKFTGKRTIVIEDKTTSDEHNQLETYNDKIKKKWKYDEGMTSDECVYKVFYKTNLIYEEELDRVKAAGWTPFGIEEIYKFFKEVPTTTSEIFNDYVKHIESLHKKLSEPSSEPIKEWDYYNFQTFFVETIDKEFKKKGWDYHLEYWQYQGRLISVAFYYHPNKENKRLNKSVSKKYPCFAYPLVEFVFKKYATSIVVYSHITYHWIEKDDEKWSWKHSLYQPSKHESKAFMELVKEELKAIPGIDIKKMDKENNQTISRELISLDQSKDVIEKKTLEKLNTYFEAFKNADKDFGSKKEDK